MSAVSTNRPAAADPRSGILAGTLRPVALAAAAAAAIATVPAAADSGVLPSSAAYGPHAVGMATSFAVDNRQRFDPWNGAYGNAEYRALLRRIDAAGQTRTVVFQLWYPAAPDAAGSGPAGARSPLPAAGGRRADFFDFFFRDDSLSDWIAERGHYLAPALIRLRGGGALAEAEGREAWAELARRVLGAPLGAWVGAPPADGRFPVIVLAHGLGGSHSMWATFAEFLASHGYVVAAPTFVSDGGLPLALNDPDSPFARQAAPGDLRQAYDTLIGQPKVLPYFHRLIFGREDGSPPEAFDPRSESVVPGGVERASAMMRNLFRQRVSDVGLVLQTVRLLGAEAESCRAALAATGSTSAARDLCGLLAGRIDAQRAGLAGHSLGAMTAQLGANHLPGVAAAMGINNAPPFSWTPPEMFGAGETEEGLPAGSRKPVAILIGDEDDFVQNVFIGFLQGAVAAAGGDPAAAFPLAPERAAPDRMENPQPVALSAWRRAMSDRALVIVRDVDHGILVDDFDRYFPWPQFRRGEQPFAQTPERVRKPTGAAAFEMPTGPGEPYTLLGWAEAPGHGEIYMPHAIRDWYARAWFDWYLKDDPAARARLLEDDPFGAATSARIEMR